MEELNNNLNNFLREVSEIEDRYSFSEEEKKVSANVLLGRLGFFYEKIRNTLEYQEEHLIFKSSLQRILRRKLANLGNIDNPAREILEDLITGGYIDNNEIPERKLEEVNHLIHRYHGLKNSLSKKFNKNLISLLACSLEECLRKETLEKEALVRFTHSVILRNVKSDITIDTQRLETQLYIAIQRALIKSDYQTIRYRLLKRIVPDIENRNIELHEISSKVESANSLVDDYFKDPLRFRFSSFVRKSIPPYSILGKMIADIPVEKYEEIFGREESLRVQADIVYSKWRERAYDKISRSAIKSVIFIFMTKMVLAFTVELPYEIFILHRLNYLALGVNLIFPPAFMFISTFNIQIPGRENLVAIKDKLSNIIYREDKVEYTLMLRKSGSMKKVVFSLIYFLTFILSFGGLVYILYLLDFSWVAGLLFFIFFSTVSFFSYRISQPAREMIMIGSKGSLKDVVIDFFSIPFIRLGQFLSSSFSQINVFLFFFDFIIETPFKTLIKFMDEWVSYAREKKDDILNQ